MPEPADYTKDSGATPKQEGRQGKYGLRFADMTAQELEYYRQFWQPDRQRQEQAKQQEAARQRQEVKARIRMANGLSFTLAAVGLLCTLIPLLAGHLWLAALGAALTLLGIGLLIAIRRRFFASLRLAGQEPTPKNGKAKWFILPHLCVLAGLVTAVVAIVFVPQIFGSEPAQLIRSHAAMWSEITLLLWLLAALLYGLVALAAYTPEDSDESLIRPSGFEQLYPRQTDDDDFYDSSWISGR